MSRALFVSMEPHAARSQAVRNRRFNDTAQEDFQEEVDSHPKLLKNQVCMIRAVSPLAEKVHLGPTTDRAANEVDIESQAPP